MRRVLAWIILAPVATIALLFALANRGWVTVSVDPFSQAAPAYAVELPLFLVMFGALIMGVLIGGVAVWFGRLRWQMAAHRAEREAARLRAEKAEVEARSRAEAFGAPRSIAPPGGRVVAR
jgi:uncharacterized integral membrane protein